ncbi:phosphoribosylanthranilate isomerase [Marinobacter xestospongiae]|uniref:N-(5'-phosphoribosyl)anthranilate isomerase n=1 Tax=Marinobacter xestospongiae TaxID=994319 RepID=A0ABU3VZT7_9GAMM|nr:phosphoribosylanthranilate isomerase [Marinobacter xestospongiae]MDV2079807.1 phosphoribosylanthranilate isomerase [Marinobacter xestospongiae]
MMKTKTKICGITEIGDALTAANAGADAIGLVFFDPSPRAVDVARAREIAAAVPAFVTLVGLFVNPDADYVRNILDQVPLDLLQFHGDESPEFCNQFGRRWIKAVRVATTDDVEDAFERYSLGSGLLLDAYDPTLYGGTGKSFDWTLIPQQRPLPLILAGGLNSDNVARAITAVKPWAVDVSGGVEIRKGVKDAARIKEFLNEVHRVDKTD